MARRIRPRLVVAALIIVLVAALTTLTGAGFAQGSAAQANYAPVNTAPPVISGTAQAGQTLTTSTGSWTYQTSPSYSFQWQRCDANGNSCAAIAGATASAYVVQTADNGATLRSVVTASSADGTTSASSAQTPVVGSTAPTNTALPAISGTAQTGQTLTTSTGTWSPTATTSYAYTWLRCNSAGGACTIVSGATAATYAVQAADLGSTLRAEVTATTSAGSTSATSAPTAVVTTPTAPTGVIAATSVVLPNRLTISGVAFQPTRLTNRAAILARFRVVDSNGRPVSGALVYAIGLPYAWTKSSAEVSTGADGWATLSISPTRSMPLGRGHALVFFVRARVPGQPLLAGSSTRRLVQVLIG
jgi:Ig domain of plant-specific actin-binding protein